MISIFPTQELLAATTGNPTLGQEIASFRLQNNVSAIAWSPNRKYLAVSYDRDRKISLFEVTSGRRLWTVEKLLGIDPPPQKVLQFSPDSTSIFTSSAVTRGADNRDKTVSIISVAEGRIAKTLAYRTPKEGQAPAIAVALAVSRDGNHLFAMPGEMGELIVYDTRSWEVAQTRIIDEKPSPFRSHIAIDEERDLLFIAENRFVAENQKIQVRHLSTGEEIRTFDTFQVGTNAITVNPRTHELVTGGDGSFESRRDAQTGQMRQFSDDPSTLVRAFNITGQQTRTYLGPGGDVEGLSVSSNGALIAASKARRLPMPPNIAALTGCIAPKSCASPSPSYVLIWNADNGALLSSKDYGQEFVGDVSFSPDDKSLAYAVNNVVHVATVER